MPIEVVVLFIALFIVCIALFGASRKAERPIGASGAQPRHVIDVHGPTGSRRNARDGAGVGGGEDPSLVLSTMIHSRESVLREQYGTIGARRASDLMAPKVFEANVVGVSFENRDGQSRQDIIRRLCQPGARLYLRREPNNPYDRHAVGVYRVGKKIGHLDKYLARRVSKHISPDYSSRKHKMSKRARHVESDQRVTGYPQKTAGTRPG